MIRLLPYSLKALTALSLVLCVMVVALWARSHLTWRVVGWNGRNESQHEPGRFRGGKCAVAISNGMVWLQMSYHDTTDPLFRNARQRLYTFSGPAAADSAAAAADGPDSPLEALGFLSESAPLYLRAGEPPVGWWKRLTAPAWSLALASALLPAVAAAQSLRRRHATRHF